MRTIVRALSALGFLLASLAPPAFGGVVAVGERTNEILDISAELAALVDDLQALPALKTQSRPEQARHALVIGIDEYEELTDLNKAIGDADSLEATLTKLGFDVTIKQNVAAREFDDAIDDFVASLKKGDVAFFFFSGHGVSHERRNFLLPADMPALAGVRESRLDRYAVDAQELVDRIYAKGVEIALVVLDACRDNPFPPDPDMRAMRAYGGLERMTPQKGAFVIYSAGVGQKALDRLGPEDGDPNSVFTRIFQPALATPGMPVVEIAKRTQVEVSALAATVTHKQEPAYYDQIVGQFYMQPPQPKLYGLVIGIDDYGKRHSLRGAVNDSDKIASTLKAAGARSIVQITNQDVRLSYIDYVWNDMIEHASPGDTLVFTFSGTGYLEPKDKADPGEKGQRTVLLLSGTKSIEDYWSKDEQHDDAAYGFEGIEPGRKLTDETFTAWMEKAARKNLNVIVMIDGCHAGGLLDREFANVSFFGAVAEDKLAQERSFDGTHYGVGSIVFAEAIAGGADLNGDGYVTQRELFAFGRQNLFNISAGHQDPQFVPSIEKSSKELVLLRVEPKKEENPLFRFWSLGNSTR